jgi:hypothetical protein
MASFVAKTEILPESQKAICPHLSIIPEHFTVFGGTAVALRYGHRNSIDFDFSSCRKINFTDFLDNMVFHINFKLNYFFLICSRIR